jgi:hypothetical protein
MSPSEAGYYRATLSSLLQVRCRAWHPVGVMKAGAPFHPGTPVTAQRYAPETEYPMSKAQDSTTQSQAGSQPKPRGKALQVNENSVEDAGPPHASPPAPEKPREQRKEKQQGEAIRVNENTE